MEEIKQGEINLEKIDLSTIEGEFFKGIFKEFKIFTFVPNLEQIQTYDDSILLSFFENYKLLVYQFIPAHKTIVCCEDKCLLIQKIDQSIILNNLKQTKSILIDIDQNTNDYISNSIDTLYNYSISFKNKNELINLTLKTIVSFIIRRNFYPSNYFKNSSFFNFDTKSKQHENDIENYLNNEHFINNLMAYSIPQQYQAQSKINLIEFHEKDFLELTQIDKNDFLLLHLETKHLMIKKPSKSLVEAHPFFVKIYGHLNQFSICEFYSNKKLNDFLSSHKDIETIFILLSRISICAKYFHSKSLLLNFEDIYIDHNYNCFVDVTEEQKIENLISIDFGLLSDLLPEIVKQSKINFSDDIFLFGYLLIQILNSNNNPNNLKLFEKIYHLNIFVNQQNGSKIDPNITINSKIEFIKAILQLFINIYHETEFEYYQKVKNYYKLGQMYQNGTFCERSFQKAKECYEKALPDSNAYVALGMMCYNGLGQSADLKQAFKYFSIAAESNNHLAYFNLGEMYSHGQYVTLNYEKAIQCYQKVNDSESFYKLGILYSNGQGVQKDFNKAIEYFEKSNSDKSLYNLGLIFQNVFKNNEKALKYFESASLLGNSEALLKLADYSIQNNQIDKAIQYYDMASKKQNSQAMLKLGQIYINMDPTKSFNFFLKSSQLGNFESFYYLALCYLNGLATNKNVEKALKYLEISAENGYSNSFFLLGFLQMNFQKDYQKAKTFFLDAVSKNNLEAVYYLGVMNYHGWGTPKNVNKAIEYFELAGIEKSFLFLGNIYSKTDLKKSIDYYQKAHAYYKIGLLLNDEKYYQLAIQNNDSNGYVGLGKFYLNTDFNKAIEYFVKASEMNNAKAFKYLGDIYSKIDLNKSIEYYTKGFSMNHKLLNQFNKSNISKSSINSPISNQLTNSAQNSPSINSNSFSNSNSTLSQSNSNQSSASISNQNLPSQQISHLAKTNSSIPNESSTLSNSNSSIQLNNLINPNECDSILRQSLFNPISKDSIKCLLKLANLYFNQNLYEKATQLYQILINFNNKESLFNLGYLYYKGIYLQKDLNKAKNLFKQSNSPYSNYYLGEAYLNEKNKEKAKKYFEKVLTETEFKSNLYIQIQDSLNLTSNENPRDKSLNSNSINNHSLDVNENNRDKSLNSNQINNQSLKINENAMLQLALIYIKEKNYSKAKTYFIQIQSDTSLLYLALMYSLGLGMPINYTKSFQLFLQLTKHDNLYGYLGLAHYYFYIDINYKKAKELYEKASNKNNEDAWYQSGIMYMNGFGCLINEQKGIDCFQKAIDLGNFDAYEKLANFLFKQNQEKIIEYTKLNQNNQNDVVSPNQDELSNEFEFTKQNALNQNNVECYHKNDSNEINKNPLNDHFKTKNELNRKLVGNNQKAFEYYNIAAMHGNTNSMLALGYLYSNGIGTCFDYRMGIKWLEEAANKNNHEANLIFNKLFDDKNAKFPLPITMTQY